jgi:hypothetical protein
LINISVLTPERDILSEKEKKSREFTDMIIIFPSIVLADSLGYLTVF